MNRRYGFDLVELMIVVAVVGILAAVAIPSFIQAKKLKDLRKAGFKDEGQIRALLYTNNEAFAQALKYGPGGINGPFNGLDEWGHGDDKPGSHINKGGGGSMAVPESSIAEGGGTWGIFQWAGRKWIAMYDSGSNVVQLFVMDGKRWTPMTEMR